MNSPTSPLRKAKLAALRAVRPFVPPPLRRRHAALLADGIETEPATAERVFAEVYRAGLWGGGSAEAPYSGPGSHDPALVGPYVEAVGEFLRRFPRRPDALDLGCGDFNVGSRLRSACGRYVACDVVPAVIAANRSRFALIDVDFRCLDICRDDWPRADVVFLRQVLQHLDNASIHEVVRKLPGNGVAIVTEHLPASDDFVPNLDKPKGPSVRMSRDGSARSGVVLTAPPFGLRPGGQELLCEVSGAFGRLRTLAYRF